MKDYNTFDDRGVELDSEDQAALAMQGAGLHPLNVKGSFDGGVLAGAKASHPDFDDPEQEAQYYQELAQ